LFEQWRGLQNARALRSCHQVSTGLGEGRAHALRALRKDLSADIRADLYATEALEAVDSNDPAGFEKALAELLALPIGDELSPRIAQLRRAAIQRNPRFLDILNRIRKD